MPTLWWHATDQPTLILGTAQALDQRALDICAGEGVLVVRRHAGGTAVFAGPDVLGMDIVLPHDHPLAIADVVEAYRWIGELWTRTTQLLGADSHLVSVAEAREAAGKVVDPMVRSACFATLSPYEVAVGPRKLVGLAQVRRRGAILVQAGIHLHFEGDALARYLGGGAGLAQALNMTALGLDEATPQRHTIHEVTRRFQQLLRQTRGVSLRAGMWSQEELEQARRSTKLALDHV
jgi:lipoate---protein ligase